MILFVLACLGNPDPLGSTAAHPDFGWSTPDSSALRRPPRPVGYQGWWAHARRTQPDSSAGVQTGDPGGLSRRLARCVFSLKTTDGVGFEPTNDFRRCRFSRSANPLRALPKRTPRKTGAKRRRGPRQLATDTLAQRPEPSQFETPQAKSRPLTRQVSDKSRLACLEMAWLSGQFLGPSVGRRQVGGSRRLLGWRNSLSPLGKGTPS